MTENLPYFIKLDFYRLHCGNAPAFGLFPDGGKAPIKTLLLYQLRIKRHKPQHNTEYR